MFTCHFCPAQSATVIRPKSEVKGDNFAPVDVCVNCLDVFEGLFKSEIRVPDGPGKETWLERK